VPPITEARRARGSDVKALMSGKVGRRGRPPRTRDQWEELLYHRYWLGWAAAANAKRAVQARGRAYADENLHRVLTHFPRWFRRKGYGRLVDLYLTRTPAQIARATLAWQYGLSEETVRQYVNASAARHRAQRCHVYGVGCFGIGGSVSIPRTIEDPRWQEVRDAWPARNGPGGPGGAPRTVRLVPT
jgi:hypothetical protein